MRLPLTDQQKAAAAAREARVYIEASPGSGKTTVAAERFGVARYTTKDSGLGVMALSFARSARGELDRRVRRRWGLDATRWPHRVWTLDSLHCALIQHLLRSGAVTWPGGHTDLTVVDSWRGIRGARPVEPLARVYELSIEGSTINLRARRAAVSGYRFTSKADFLARLGEGLCTHDEVRQVLSAATEEGSPLRDPIRDFFKRTVKALIVDEIFDGNLLDLRIVAIAAEAGVPTTVIGDPWQALYAFRGARPDLVPQLVTAMSFATYEIDESFRFRTPEMMDLASGLRTGRSIRLSPGTPGDADVVLASRWDTLWSSGTSVLPLSFGMVGNRLDAALSVLLDHVVRAHFAEPSVLGADAEVILGLDPDVLRSDGPPLLTAVLERLAPGGSADAEAALELLREGLRALGSVAITRLHPKKEADRARRLQLLAARLDRGDLVPAMTIHQAKGREWDRVATVLTESEVARLAAGLSISEATDRALYVALTRARQRTTTA